MTNQFTNSAVAYLRNKLAAAAEEMHEAAESPEQEALEHASGAGEGGEAHEEGGIEHLLSQLSPEELEQLAAELSGDIQNPGATEGGEDVAGLAHAISAHLGQTPEADVAVSDPQKQAAFEFVKSASYIHGFINQAVHDGVSVKTAVDLYDSSLAMTIHNLKEAELSGGQHKLDVNKNGKIDSSDLKKLRANKSKASNDMDPKTAAYYDGVFERAREYGIPDYTTVAIIKSATIADNAIVPTNSLVDFARSTRTPFRDTDMGKLTKSLADSAASARTAASLSNPLSAAAGRFSPEGLSMGLGAPEPGMNIEGANFRSNLKDLISAYNPASSGDAFSPEGLPMDAGVDKLKQMISHGNLGPEATLSQLGHNTSPETLNKIKDMARGDSYADFTNNAGLDTHTGTGETLNKIKGMARGDSYADSLNIGPMEGPPMPSKIQMLLNSAKKHGRELGGKAQELGGKAQELGSSAVDYLKTHPEQAMAGGGILAGGAGLLALQHYLKKKKQEEEGVEQGA